MPIIEPGKQDKKLTDYLNTGEYQKVLIVFIHGLGDLLMFLKSFGRLKDQYPDIQFDLGLQNNVGQEKICFDAILLDNLDNIEEGYDLSVLVHFPMSENDNPVQPKSEKCCKEELGIESINEFPKLEVPESRLVGVSFQATAMTGNASLNIQTAEKIWSEIIEAGFIPIEVTMEHVYHNPQNEKFPFIQATLRHAKPNIETMISIIGRCYAFLGVSSGPLLLALSLLPHNRVAFLEKDYKLQSITNESLKTFNKDNTDIKQWLTHL